MQTSQTGRVSEYQVQASCSRDGCYFETGSAQLQCLASRALPQRICTCFSSAAPSSVCSICVHIQMSIAVIT
jgi:hypothetical protein